MPVAVVAGGRQFRQIDAGDYCTRAVTPGDRAYCWGTGYLGNGSTRPAASTATDSPTPDRVVGPE